GSWLHGVAYRIAANLKRDIARRRVREAAAAGSSDTAATGETSWQEVRVVLDEEISRLPERWRGPPGLRFLGGRAAEEGAPELGWSLGTLRGRLERGRDLLRSRLTRRGLTLSAALLGGLLAEGASAGVPAALVGSTVKAAALRAAGAAVVSARAVALAQGV